MNSKDLKNAGFENYSEVINNDLLLEMILSNINIYNLNRLKLVCKKWFEHISKIESRRKFLEYNFYLEPLLYVNNRKRSNDHVIQDYIKTLNKYLIEDGTACSSLNAYAKNFLWSMPQTCLIFSSLPRKNYLSFQSNFSSFSKSISINSRYGVIGTLDDGYSVEVEDNLIMTGLSALFIPNLSSKICINCFKYDNNLNSLLFKEKDVKDSLKCLLLFSTDSLHCSLLNDLIVEKKGNFALGGAVVNEITLFENGNLQKLNSILITFSGKNVKSASLILETKSQSEIEAKIKSFKENLDFDINLNENEAQTFGFIFTCVGKGSYHYNKSNIETSLISKYFPKTKVMGIFGQGEYGHSYLNSKKILKLDFDCCKNVKEDVYAHHLSYTSIIVFVHFIKN